IFEDIGLNFGVLVFETDEQGIPLSIPGLMEEGEIGYFAVEGKRKNEKFYFSGPPDNPFVRGNIVLYNSRVTFPFIGMEEDAGEGQGNPVVEFLMNTEWDVLVLSGGGNRYFVEIPAYFGEAYMDLDSDNDSDGLEFSGKWNNESFRVEGGVSSSRGSVEYLDNNFRVQKFGAEFSRFELYPTVYGKAYTTVRDSSGQFPRDIYLVLYAIDPETNQEISRGRWEDFRFKLVSSDPVEGETQEQVLAYMGYSVKNLPGKAGEVGLTMTENLLMRPIVRPIERRIERGLGLDYVRFRSRFTSNLLYMSMHDQLTFLNSPLELGANLNNNLNPALLLFQSSQLTLGKYLTRDLYFNYTGQLLSGYEESNFDKPRLGFYHRFGVEYRLLRNLLLEIEYDNFQLKTYYYNRADLNDFRIRLRHSFHF
ncbi:MAG: translocation/assembly module TamB domain-containing protein, partial [Calditrichia bacterium]